VTVAGFAAPWPGRRVRSSRPERDATQGSRVANFAPGRPADVARPGSVESSAGNGSVTNGSLASGSTVPLEAEARAAAEWVPPSWDEVVREHGNRVYRLAYRLTGNAHDAEDLTQDVFVRVFRSLADYTPGTFEGWLHRITTNLFLDRMRRQQKIRFDALPDDTERLAGREASPEVVYADSHLDADIEAALAALPPDFRAAVVLCDIEQLSYEEIAQTLGVKLGTVRSRISRGRAMLRQALTDRAPRAVRPEGAEAQAALAETTLAETTLAETTLAGAVATAAVRAAPPPPEAARAEADGPAPRAERIEGADSRGRVGRRRSRDRSAHEGVAAASAAERRA
jgi:RNA polymerase sigma factor (sigma-70 family)